MSGLNTPVIVKHISDQNEDSSETYGVVVGNEFITEFEKSENGDPMPITNQYVLVAWNHQRTPFPAKHKPEELVWLDIPALTENDDNIEDDFLDEKA